MDRHIADLIIQNGIDNVIEKELEISLDDLEFKKNFVLVHLTLDDEDRENAIEWAIRKEDYEWAQTLKCMGEFMKSDELEAEYMGLKIKKK